MCPLGMFVEARVYLISNLYICRNSSWGEQTIESSGAAVSEETHSQTYTLQQHSIDPCPAQQQLI